jgi:hypothetical protein
MNTPHHNSSRGFVALISIIMLSVVLLATTLSLAQFGLANRYFLLDLENKNRSEKLAEACVHMARISIYNDPLYDENSLTIPVGDDECTIVSVDADSPSSGESTIQARGQSNDSITNVEVVITASNGEFQSWREVSSF